MKGWNPDWLRAWKEGLGKYRYALLVMALGAVLLLLPTSGGETEAADRGAEVQSDAFNLEAFEEKLETILSQVEGAGSVRVVLTLDSGSRQVLAQDVDRDGQGGGASTTVTVGQGSGTREVVPLQTIAPEFRGALVVCPGGGNPQVKLKLIEAVSALTGLGSDCISICQGSN